MKTIEIYQSKKDPSVTAKLEKKEEKYGTVLLEYITGNEVGKTISITSSTLKRWWKLLETKTEGESFEDTIDYEKVNTKYPEPKEKKYIPKPQSVIEYEAKKEKRYNSDLPTQDCMVERFASILSKINKTYIVFKTSGCWLERKSGYINLYASEEVWKILSEKGMEARKNGMKNTKLPVVFKITTMEEYELVAGVLENV